MNDVRHIVPMLAAALLLAPASGCGESDSSGLAGSPCAATSDCADDLVCGAGAICIPRTVDTSVATDAGPDTSSTDTATSTSTDATTADVPEDTDASTEADAAVDDVDAADAVDALPDACAPIVPTLAPVPSTAVFLIDRSGSLGALFEDPTTTWQALSQVLFGSADDGVLFTRDGEAGLRLGMAIYAAADVEAVCPLMDVVAPASGSPAAMASLYSTLSPYEDTPTADAVRTAIPLFDDAPAGGERVLVLVTAGNPDTCAVPDPQEGLPDALAAVAEASAAGITTRPVYVRTGYEAEAAQMARAGSGLPVDGSGGDAPVWTATTSPELASAIDGALDAARPCTFALSDATIVDASMGNVTSNGSALSFGDPDGWVLAEPCGDAEQCIVVQGSACQDLRATATPEIVASFPCGAASTP